MANKSVFISYRRDTIGKLLSRHIESYLERHGYDVWLDVKSLESGKWNEQIENEIPLRGHFVLIIHEGSLDRCCEEDDWVRREYELALRTGRNIVPVFEESFDLKSKTWCPEELSTLRDFQGVTIRHESEEADLKKLTDQFLTPTKAAPPFSQASDSATSITPKPPRIRIGGMLPFHFIGKRFRDREVTLRLLKDKVADPSVRIVVIEGRAGQGKSALAARLCEKIHHAP